MKERIAFFITEDKCASNNKTAENIKALKAKLEEYGEYKDLDAYIGEERVMAQNTIVSLEKRLADIQEQKLTEDELVFIRFYRQLKVSNCKTLEEKVALLEKQLVDIKTEHINRNKQIIALVGEGQ